jgi:hypothetical protein
VRSLDQILDLLQRYHQRATYGAVASLLGTAPRALMQGRPRDWRHSWVVNKETGLPGEYPSGKVHPALTERPEILESGADLEVWLEQRRQNESRPNQAGD